MINIENWINPSLVTVFSTIIIYLTIKILKKYEELKNIYKESRELIGDDLSDIIKIKNEYKEFADLKKKLLDDICKKNIRNV